MNVALVASSFHPHLGGVEELSRQLGRELIRQGNRVCVHTNRWPKKLAARDEVSGMMVRRHVFRVPEWSARQMAGACLAGPSTLARFVGHLRADHSQVIHVQCVSSNAYYALAARRRLGLPLVVTLQGELTMDANRLFQRSRFAQGLLRRVLDEAEVITACSTRTLRDAEAFYGQVFGPRGRVIWNGANVDELCSTPAYVHPRPYLLALGRLAWQKGFDILLAAFASSGCLGHDLLIAGEGDERESLSHLIGALNLTGRAQLIGRADRARVAGLLKGCTAFILPSRADEGLPVVIAEALSAGCAVIATRTGGTPEAVGEQTGAAKLVERENVAELSAAIAEVCRSAALREAMSSAARSRADLFRWPTLARQYLDAYRDAIDQVGKAAR